MCGSMYWQALHAQTPVGDIDFIPDRETMRRY